MKKGVYTLLLQTDTIQNIRIGALGEKQFVPGWYIYVGSALGSGGLDRMCRHIRYYHEHYRKPKWHIDYLMDKISLEKVIYAETDERMECLLSRSISGDGIQNFGCSDCNCETHLYFRHENPEKEIMRAFHTCGLQPEEIAVNKKDN